MISSLLLVSALLVVPSPGQLPDAPTSLFDPRLDELRTATVKWSNRLGPSRQVVDQVVIVTDLASFFHAISSWDRGHWFPVLFDDPILTPKFLRAFRPRQVLRLTSSRSAIAPDRLWEEAGHAVEQSWAPAGPRSKGPPSAHEGESPPADLGPTPPGIVLSHPESESLAGAVALAAGHFQPLLRWQTAMHRGEIPTTEQATDLSLQLTRVVASLIPRFARLGDDCDFLTLAGDYPYRLNLTGKVFREGNASFDDWIGRDRDSLRRWAYASRLEGGAAQSVYTAMCALFLQPSSALLYDTYDAKIKEFKPYSMTLARNQLRHSIKVAAVLDGEANLSNFHTRFASGSAFDLIYMNTRGGPNSFGLSGGLDGITSDLPQTGPCVVLMNHSFSAADPADVNTLAGRWLSEGAYLYFGSVNEPYIQSFRTPELVLSLLAGKIPFAAAVRMLPSEHPVFGYPWRLLMVGDPLYRFDDRQVRKPRGTSLPSTSSWTVLQDKPAPGSPATDADPLSWVQDAVLLDAAANRRRDSVAQVLLAIRRDAIPEKDREPLDAMRIDLAGEGLPRKSEVVASLSQIPRSEQTLRVRQFLGRETLRTLKAHLDQNQWEKVWEDFARLGNAPMIDDVIARAVLSRITNAALRSGRIAEWKGQIETALQSRLDPQREKMYRDELSELARRVKTP